MGRKPAARARLSHSVYVRAGRVFYRPVSSRGFPVRRYTQSLTVTGCVTDLQPQNSFFTIKSRSGDTFEAFVTSQTSFQVVQNLDGLDNDRVPNPNNFAPTAEKLIQKYINKDQFIVVQGVYQ